MKIKVSTAEGAVLDWMVGTACGYEMSTYGVDPSLRARVLGLGVHAPWRPSTYWVQGGQIIEREKIGTREWDTPKNPGGWYAGKGCGEPNQPQATGPTLLIAAMRCYVVSKLGEEVDVPEELYEQVPKT